MPTSYSTLYVRHVFHVADARAVERLSLYVWADDAFVAYLNGVEVGRRGIGNGGDTPVHDAWADSRSKGWVPIVKRINPKLLRVGENCLAIQGLDHKVSRGEFLLNAVLAAEMVAPAAIQPGSR